MVLLRVRGELDYSEASGDGVWRTVGKSLCLCASIGHLFAYADRR